jgi:hypothetical protein
MSATFAQFVEGPLIGAEHSVLDCEEFRLDLARSTAEATSRGLSAEFSELHAPQLKIAGPGIALTIRFSRTQARSLLTTIGSVNPLVVSVGGASGAYGRGDPRKQSAAVLVVDSRRGIVDVSTPTIGLPPVYILRTENGLTLTSSLRWACNAAGRTPSLSNEAVADLFAYGYPIARRTLYSGIEQLPAATTTHIEPDLSLRSSGGLVPPINECPSSPLLVEAMCAAFDQAVRSINTDRCVLSLSGGLDSRVILAGLARHHRSVPCVTMGVSEKSPDVVLAKAACDAVGIDHTFLALGANFQRQLPDLVIAASRLSGGVDCIQQARDVYLYSQLGSSCEKRISGNVGNQLCHLGVEGMAMRNAAVDVLAPEFARLERLNSRPWFAELAEKEGAGRALLTKELPFASVANHLVGSHFARQLIPYADPNLVSLGTSILERQWTIRGASTTRLRFRDLQHRLIGPRRAESFQCEYIRRYGGPLAKVPINAGWLVDGGWSWPSALSGMREIASLMNQRFGIALLSPSKDHGSGEPSRGSGTVNWRRLVTEQLRTLILDTLMSASVSQAGVFDQRKLNLALDEHFSGKADHYETVVSATEVGLALQN